MSTAVSAPLAQPMPTPMPGPPSLTRRQKAAVVVRLMLADGLNLSLKDLPDNLQAELIHQMATLRHVDHATIQAVAADFIAEFSAAGISFPGALEGALSLLDGTISKETASRVRKQAGLAAHGDPWKRVGEMDAEALLPVLESESVEVGAVILSKLKVSKAAEVLGMLPGERARRIAFAVSLTGSIAPAVVHKIGCTIAEQLDAQPELAFDEGPVERVGAILNFSPSATREDVLDGLEQADSGFANQVRKAIFTFANIPARIDPRDIPKIIREVDPDQLITALTAASNGAEAEVVEFILANMSQRMAGQLKEDIAARGDVNVKDGDMAMTAVTTAIRNLESIGEIFLVAEDE